MAKISLIGRLGADAEVKIVSEKQMVSFNLAENQKKTDKQSGEVTDYTVWYGCSLFLKSEKVINHLKKGNRVLVEGKISFEDYKANDGTIRHGKNIWVTDLQLIDFTEAENKSVNDDDDIPF